jgi:hypothetical protein
VIREGLLDATEIMDLVFNPAGMDTKLAMFYAILQQSAAQLAAIRETLEAEHEYRVAQRRKETGWPPAGSEPYSQVG